MSFIDRAYVETAITVGLTNALFPTSAEFNQFQAEADARVMAECHRAGYTMVDPANPPGGMAGTILKAAALYVMLMNGSLMRRNIIQDFGAIQGLINPSLIGKGEYPLPGLVPNQLGAVGGIQIFTGDGPVFSLSSMRGR